MNFRQRVKSENFASRRPEVSPRPLDFTPHLKFRLSSRGSVSKSAIRNREKEERVAYILGRRKRVQVSHAGDER